MSHAWRLASRGHGTRTGSNLAAAGTTVVHAAAAFFLFGAVSEQEPTPEVYAVQLVAAPEQPEVKRPEVVQRQSDPPPPAPDPEVREVTPPEEVAPPPPEPKIEKEPIPEAATEVSPLPGVVSEARPARYRSISWSEYRGKRTDGDYADFGTEFQIAQFRIEK